VNPNDRWIVIAQMVVAFLLIVFGACLAAFGGLSGSASTTGAIPLAVIGAGAALLPGGAAGAASARILQMLPSSATPDLAELSLAADSGNVGTPINGVVMLTAPAAPGGFGVTLVADPSGAADLTSSVTVAAGSSVAQFVVTPKQAGKITVTATAGSTSKSASLTAT
jgi:hypothetical protein